MRPVILTERVALLCGDSKTLDLGEGSIDAVVCDPPYELGFMGRKWDSSGIAYDVELWRAVYRALKPGGHLLAFGGTRTYHRMACAIEDAGFEIRDSLHWVYGCLDEQSEILTETGWKLGIDVQPGERVAAWDAETEEVRIAPVLDKTRAPFHGEMVRFKNDNTDQRLTPNHRVYKRHALRKMTNGVRARFFEDSWNVAEAGEINRYQPIKLPLAGYHDGRGIGGADWASFLGWIFTEGGFDVEGTGVRITQTEANPDHCTEIAGLVAKCAPNAKLYTRERTYTPPNGSAPRPFVEHTWFFSGASAQAVRDALPGKHPTFDLLWSMSLEEKRAFLGAAMRGDGSGTAFYQKDPADREWFATLAHVVGWQARDNARKSCVSLHANPTTELQSRHLKTSREQYDGEVWCVRVSTGAFLARRNGRIFITGNSGFPKSKNVSKAIDEKLGATPIDLGRPKVHGDGKFQHSTSEEARIATGGRCQSGVTVHANATSPATEQAKAWSGWGTALKPAHEPIILARKPLEGTVAANVLAEGTGAINIGECRIGSEARVNPPAGNKPGGNAFMMSVHGMPADAEAHDAVGRWPANFLLSHLDECEAVGTREARRNVGSAVGGDCDREGTVLDDGGLKDQRTVGSTKETIEEYRCAPGCPVGELGESARFYYCAKPSTRERDFGCEALPVKSGGEATDREDGSAGLESPRAGAGRKGGRRNVHPTVKPIDLMRWLCRLITPPGGTILDPFTGSGTTGIAAIREGFSFVGVEMDSDYIEIAKARISKALEEKK